jgi:uncharacterized protein (TIGR00299 family) protein
VTRIAYFDCFSGVSGDMTLGALLDAGLPLEVLLAALDKLTVHEFELEAYPVLKQGISATQVVVRAQEGHVHRGLPEIRAIIQGSELPEPVKASSLAVFTELAKAEAAIHGSTLEEVHFHEVGAVDAIVDIVGACFGLHWLGIEKIICSPLPTGGGQARSAHGIIPIPAPATLALLASRQVPLYDNGQRIELVTPTGAALMVALADSFGGYPAFRPERVGYGAGQKDLSVANVLRIVLGEAVEQGAGRSTDHEHRHDHRHPQGHHHDHSHEHSHEHSHRHEHDHDHEHEYTHEHGR